MPEQVAKKKIKVPNGMLEAFEDCDKDQQDVGAWVSPRRRLEAALRWLDKELEEMDKDEPFDRDLQIGRVRALWTDPEPSAPEEIKDLLVDSTSSWRGHDVNRWILRRASIVARNQDRGETLMTEKVAKKKIKIPEGMLKAARERHNQAIYLCAPNTPDIKTALEDALRWLAEHPIVPTSEQVEEMIFSAPSPSISSNDAEPEKFAIVEWQRRMFLKPEHKENQ